MYPPHPLNLEPAASHPLRILYAEDVRELRELARLVFAHDGHVIECTVDGMEALERIEGGASYDLVITDHHMPRMNGLELVTAIRRLGYPAKLMVFSSELSPAVADEYRKLNVDRILFKPVYPSYLRQVLAELFPAATAPVTA